MIGPKHRTLREPVTISGVGVHSGVSCTLTFRPDTEGRGIRFKRVDIDDAPEIPATLEHVVATELGTTIAPGDDGATVATVEHVMAALWARGVSRVVVELDGPEPPVLDGSFKGYIEAIDRAGVVELDDDVPVMVLSEPVSWQGGQGSRYVAVPADDFCISATIEFQHPLIGRQYGAFPLETKDFMEEIGPARTFGFESEGNTLRSRGLALGTSLENTIVLGEEGILNDELRFPDEFLRHKVGDMVGDLALLGARLQAHVIAERPSHAGNVEMGRAIANQVRRRGSAKPVADIQQILQYLPHRFPMLLVDRVTEFESGKRIVGVKNVTINEPFFQGHYPGHPIMPGVLIIEAMAQVGGLLLMDTVEDAEDKVVYFMSLDNVKWRRPVTPGDQLVFEMELVQRRSSVCRMRGEGYVDGNLVAEAELMARIMDR